MGPRAKAIFPLALVIGVLSFLWTEFSLNFTFHWVTNGALDPTGQLTTLELPKHFHLILPTAFIAWGMFFAAGGDNAAFGKIVTACIFGTVAAFLTMGLAFKTATQPDFWGIALWVGVFAFILVMVLVLGDWYYVAGTFPAFASVFLWWIATGLDGWWPNGGGVNNDLTSVGASFSKGILSGDPEAARAGTGAFGGVLSTPWGMVFVNSLVTLICGAILGILSGKLAAALTPKPAAAE